MGYGILFDPLLDYHFFTISSSRPKFTELTVPKLEKTPLHATPPRKKTLSKSASYLAYPFPDISLLRPQARNIQYALRIPPHILREKDPLSTEAISILGKYIILIRTAAGQIVQVGNSLRQRSHHILCLI
jgi:hypothetical protein